MTEAAPSRSGHAVVLPRASGRKRLFTPQSTRPSSSDEQHAALVRAQRISRTGSWEFDYRTSQVTVSDQLLELVGIDRDALAFGGHVLANGVHDDDRAFVIASMRGLIDTGEPINIRYRTARSTDGAPAWFTARGEAEHDALGNLVRVTCIVADISELVHAEQELSAATAFHQAVIATTPDAIHLIDIASGTYMRANRSGEPITGYTAASVAVMSGENLEELLPVGDWAQLCSTLSAAGSLADGDVVQVRHRVYEPDGAVTWLSRHISVFARCPDGTPTQLLVVSRDVTDVVEVEQLLEHAATHDELTALPNRRYVQDRLNAFLTGTGTAAAAVLIVDLDGFKQINDAHGHAMGDQVLIAVARRLAAATRAGDTVARLGGDEFMVVLWTEDAAAAASLAGSLASRVEAALREPIVSLGRECSVTASIGISIVGQDTAPESALAEADAAMYSVKRHGANGHAVFDAALAEQTRTDEIVERSLHRALREGVVGVHYQPIVAPGTGLVRSVEALVRLADDDGRPLNAASVIAVAERIGLITELDDLVLRQACEQVRRWRTEANYADLRLSINRSAQDILRAGFPDRIRSALDASNLPATALTLEITETVLLEVTAETMLGIRRIYEDGVRLAIDDFGTGYASLSQLTMLPISAIKIDRSFTSNMLDDRTCRALVRATVGIAEDLGLDCVVEGVESEELLAALPRYRKLLIQGYLYGRPRPATDGLGVNAARW
jgi:diguanylate cyclase (GGDEF)-like protein/PAS domain S-box-containing protein